MKATPTWAIPYPEPVDHTRTWEYWQGQAERVDTCLTTVKSLCPFAISAVTANVSMANTSVQTVAISFPPGRFTQVPIAVVAAWHASTAYAPILSFLSATSVTAGARHIDGTATSGTVTINVLAVQMLSGAGPGMVAATADNAVATCHTDGCDNSGLPIPIYRDDTMACASCGVCGQPITDVAALS